MKAVKEKVNKYYKIVQGYFDDFNQPPLTSNGTMGGDSFAVSASTNGGAPDYGRGTAYGACYPQNGRYSTYSKGGAPTVWFTLYTPTPTIVSSFTYSATWNSGGVYVTFSGSNDNSTWTILSPQSWRALGYQTVSIENTTAYKYYMLTISTTGGGDHDGINISQVKLIGKEYSSQLQEVSADDDYDVVIESRIYHLPIINDVYYAVKSYKKGQYYGN